MALVPNGLCKFPFFDFPFSFPPPLPPFGLPSLDFGIDIDFFCPLND